jgi:hypothetical protein
VSRHRAIIPVSLYGVGYLSEIHRTCLKRARRKCRRIMNDYFRRKWGNPSPELDRGPEDIYSEDDEGIVW